MTKMSIYKRSLDELQKNAVMHWSRDMLKTADALSALPILLETQDDFIALLKIASKTPDSWRVILEESETLTPSIFLKHLMILSDLGGEALNKLTPLSDCFANKKMTFNWGNQVASYSFKEIGDKCSLTNSALKVDSKAVNKNLLLTDRMQDVIMLLLFGALDTDNNLPKDSQDRCNIGLLLGENEKIEKFVKENYIRVSKQLAGEKANSLGHASQKYVAKMLSRNLPRDWIIEEEGTLTGVSHAEDKTKLTNFDLVVKSPENKEFGVEVSFQVTTNSTIERKARESYNLHQKSRQFNHRLCYVIDGAGNINVRKKAITTLCQNSDYAVAMSDNEIKLLASYMIGINNSSIID